MQGFSLGSALGHSPKIVPDVRKFADPFGQFVRDDFRKRTLYGYQLFIYNFGLMGTWTRCFLINESQLQTHESRTLFLMTSLQYYCILELAEIKTLHPRGKIMRKNAGCAGNKITADMHSDAIVFLFYKTIADWPNFCKGQTGLLYFTPLILIH